MKNETILNEIISEGQVNEVASLNLAEIISHLLSNLNPREQDVLRRRYGLAGSEKETLESIGRAHKLTRERIRQIENVSVNKIKKNQSSEKLLSKLQKTVGDLLSEHGGVIDKAYLFKILHQLAKLQNVNSESAEYYNHLSFLTSRIINDNLEELNDQELFNDLLKLKEQGIEHLAEVATEALNKISEAKLMVATDDLIDLILKSSTYQKHVDKFQAPGNLDFSNQMKEAFA